jgi:hypothetical protein
MAPVRRKRSSLSCDVGGLPADATTIDALARLQLAARRRGYEVQLCNASQELVDLVAFVGLRDVLRVEAQR